MNSTFDVFKNKLSNDTSSGGIITYINPFSYLFLRRNISLFNQFDRIGIDGISLVVLLSFVGIKVPRRESFDMTSMAKVVLNDCATRNMDIYFIGSTENSIQDFIRIIKESFPKLRITGYRNGFFNCNDERKLCLEKIVKLNPKVVIVGMGTPYQEQFLIDLKNTGWIGMGYTCGGFIHQTAAGIRYYPEFFDKNNLRWLYRMIDEPKLIRRYLILYPKSTILFLVDFVKYKYFKT